MPVSVNSMNYYIFIFIVMCLTFLLQYLEPFLGLSVQVLQVLWPAALNENILLVVLRGPVVDGQPLLVFIPLRASCWKNREDKCNDKKLFVGHVVFPQVLPKDTNISTQMDSTGVCWPKH